MAVLGKAAVGAVTSPTPVVKLPRAQGGLRVGPHSQKSLEAARGLHLLHVP